MDSLEMKKLILSLLPKDGIALGTIALKKALDKTIAKDGFNPISDVQFEQIKVSLIGEGKIVKGRGATVKLGVSEEKNFNLDQTKVTQDQLNKQLAEQAEKKKKPVAKKQLKEQQSSEEKEILSYRHGDKRKNNPEVGMVTPDTDHDDTTTEWCYDPHIDPELQFDPGSSDIEKLIDNALASGDIDTMQSALQELKRRQSPYLNWAGKAEGTTFSVDTVSLHVHERIDPMSILAAVQQKIKSGKKETTSYQFGLFNAPFENLSLREAIDFYSHEKGWSNRLISGDSLLVMNSLLEKEAMSEQLQMIYIDPPYGIKYGSNFQPFVDKRDVKDRKDEDLTQEPEMIKAFRDTWELGIHSYLTYLRDRLLLSAKLLKNSGSIFVQISDENLHHVRELMDEVFGKDNFVSIISYSVSSGMGANLLPRENDFIVWYAKDISRLKYHQLYENKVIDGKGAGAYKQIHEPGGKVRNLQKSDFDSKGNLITNGRILRNGDVTKPGPGQKYDVFYNGKSFNSGKRWWGLPPESLIRATKAERIVQAGNSLVVRRYLDDWPAFPITNVWSDTGTGAALGKVYAVQTNDKVIERCILMTTDPGDLVFDPTCGSGTTATVAEKWGRRWITCDTSRVAITLAKQRLMTSSYDYYKLKYAQEGIKGGFIYKSIPHITLKSVANNVDIDEIYDKYNLRLNSLFKNINKGLIGRDIKFKIQAGMRKGMTINFSDDTETVARHYDDSLKGEPLFEWELPHDFQPDWPETIFADFNSYFELKNEMLEKMKGSISSQAEQELLYDQAEIDRSKLRITGPFSVEAVPFPSIVSIVDDNLMSSQNSDISVSRSGESSRQHQWRDELLKTGIRGKSSQVLEFAELETLPDSTNLQATGTLKTGERVVVSFGPAHAALEQRQVEMALREAEKLRPAAKFIIFCAFTFDPEAAKDIDEMTWPGVTLLKAQMNTDLLTEDLKKKSTSSQSFWLMGQPDVEFSKDERGRYIVNVNGFDYFNTKTGELESGGKKKIAMWMLDTDYDERSLFPHQVFFPIAGAKDGWNKLKKDLRAELDEDKLQAFHGTTSLPFEAGENKKIAVKIVDDRGIESLKVISLN